MEGEHCYSEVASLRDKGPMILDIVFLVHFNFEEPAVGKPLFVYLFILLRLHLLGTIC
jgi:hypothetical protein